MIPILARTTLGMAVARRTLRSPVVLVPTMGALHDGHRALLRRGRELADLNGSLAVSIFVNPLQFGPGADLDRYPRALGRDLEICAEEGVSAVFAPLVGQMYPVPQTIMVDPGPVGQVLEGAFRPGFFTGVLTVVLKIFNLIEPDIAIFGQKDAQQAFLVRRMAADLNLGIDIVTVPTVREPDGVAASSRNSYLSEAERVTARSLSLALSAGAAAASSGPAAALRAARAELSSAQVADPPLVVDYLELVDPAAFSAVGADYEGQALMLVAATVGKTRLIDNTPLTIGGTP
jgi:pantoate--beta-alanine ligase